MGTIFGTAKFLGGYYIDDYNDTIVGESGDDTIYGLGGDDTIWGNTGHDKMYGGYGNDVIKPGVPNVDITWNWGWDQVYGGPGNDTLDFSKTTGAAHLYGEADSDTLIGGSGPDILDGGDGDDQLYGNGSGDTISGGAGLDWAEGGDGKDYIYGGDYIDYLFGDAGNDYLYGDAGNDVLDGGADHDVLTGGAGRDFMTGGPGLDTFKFEIPNGWTDSKVSDPDHVQDFDAAWDWIDTPTAGTPSNYVETMIAYDFGYDLAKSFGNYYISEGARYAFITDGVDGYLFGDLNGNGTCETGIVLKGLTSVDDFDYWAII
jgi:Ca2+-binding RTX toxin-like protein